MVMKECWKEDPNERPTFSQLQTEISSTLTTMAGYMEFSEFASVDSIDSDGPRDRDAKVNSDEARDRDAEADSIVKND